MVLYRNTQLDLLDIVYSIVLEWLSEFYLGQPHSNFFLSDIEVSFITIELSFVEQIGFEPILSVLQTAALTPAKCGTTVPIF